MFISDRGSDPDDGDGIKARYVCSQLPSSSGRVTLDTARQALVLPSGRGGVGNAEVMSLDLELYSQEAPDFVTENNVFPKAIERISLATQSTAVWVMDREGDRQKILNVPLNQGYRFVFR